MMDVDVAEGGGRGERGKGREAGREAGGRVGGRKEGREEERERGKREWMKDGREEGRKGGRKRTRKQDEKQASHQDAEAANIKKMGSRCPFLIAQMHLSRKKEMLARQRLLTWIVSCVRDGA